MNGNWMHKMRLPCFKKPRTKLLAKETSEHIYTQYNKNIITTIVQTVKIIFMSTAFRALGRGALEQDTRT